MSPRVVIPTVPEPAEGPASGDILVKFLMNENETSVPLKTDCYPFYHWKDVSNYYRTMLKEANITYKTKIEKEEDDEDD